MYNPLDDIKGFIEMLNRGTIPGRDGQPLLAGQGAIERIKSALFSSMMKRQCEVYPIPGITAPEVRNLGHTHGSEEQKDTEQGPENKKTKTEEPEPETKDNTMLSMVMTKRETEEQRTIQSMWEQCAEKTDINKYVAAVAIFTEKEHQGTKYKYEEYQEREQLYMEILKTIGIRGDQIDINKTDEMYIKVKSALKCQKMIEAIKEKGGIHSKEGIEEMIGTMRKMDIKPPSASTRMGIFSLSRNRFVSACGN